MNYDLIVLGGGPGGYRAALEAAKSRLKTALVEKAKLGGTCLNRGCVPTKLFLGSTSVLTQLKSQKRLRLARGEASFDLAGLQARKKSIIAASQKSMRSGLESLGVDIFTARGSMGGNNTVLAGEDRLGFKHLVLASGSRSGFVSGLQPDHKNILTSTDALELAAVPESLAVIGAGPVGLEIGQIFNRLGARIILVEALDRIAPMEDEQVSRELARYLKREGWDIRTGTKVVKLSIKDNQTVMRLEAGEEVIVEKCLLALGRVPNTADLNLEAENIRVYGPGWIKTDHNLKASDNVYAVGDVNGRSLYAHSAQHQGEYVLKHILGRTSAPYGVGPAPSCIYGAMEVIRTGQSRRELASGDEAFSVSHAKLAANPIVQSHGQVQGFIKVFWQDDRVAGITGIGYGLSGLITLAQVITDQKWTRQDAKNYIFAHPTLDEALQEALLTRPGREDGRKKETGG